MGKRHLVYMTVLVVLAGAAFPLILPPHTAAAAGWGPAAEDGLDGGFHTAQAAVASMAEYDGDLYVGTHTEGTSEVWRWDGAQWEMAGAPGFGEEKNYGVMSMAVFGTHLYAGTFHPEGCEVWRWDGSSWTRVVGPGGGIGRGFGDADNAMASSMAVFGSYLYAGTVKDTGGLQIWRTSNGTSWTRADGGALGGNNDKVLSMAVFGSYLYVGTHNSTGCQVWRSSNGTTWTVSSAGAFGDLDNKSVSSLAVFGGWLYAGTENSTDGLRVYRTQNGLDWFRRDGDAFGASNTAALCMAVFGGQLHVGIYNVSSGAEVWRSPDGTSWGRVDDGAMSEHNSRAAVMLAYGGNLLVGTQGAGEVWSFDGSAWSKTNVSYFTTNHNVTASSMATLDGYLYVGTGSILGCELWRHDGSRWEKLGAGGFEGNGDKVASSMAVYGSDLYIGTEDYHAGCQVWRWDGTSFTKVATGGFGNPNNRYARCMAVYGGRLYVGTYNSDTGGELWAWDGSVWSQVNADGFGDGSNLSVNSLAVTGGVLYASTHNVTGGEVWASEAEGGPPYVDWAQVNANGFGNAQNIGVPSLAVMGDLLFAGTHNAATGCEVWAWDGSAWNKAGTGGFGDAMNREATAIAVHEGRLYVGTQQESWLGGTGCEVWSTAGAGGYPFTDWVQEGSDGFGDALNVEATSMAVYFSSVHVGTSNNYHGCEVWTSGSVWYLAEGATMGGFETWVLVQNPGGQPVHVDFTLNTDAGEVKPPDLQVVEIPAGSRRSFSLGNWVQTYDVSTKVEARDGKVVCERAMYWNPASERVLGHDSIGVTSPSPTWYLAEGATAGGFETWVLVQNPGAAPVHVDFTLNTDTGEVKPTALQGVEIPAGSRASFSLGNWVSTYDVSTKVDCGDGEVICERAMYWTAPGESVRRLGHDSIGVTSPTPYWYLAEGATTGGFETWLLIQNPYAGPVHVDITLNTDAGEVKPPQLQGYEIPASSRRSINLGDYGSTYDVSAFVHSTDGLVICERAMYWTPPGQPWRVLGHDSVGANLPRPVWYLAEGATAGGFETWVLVQNPEAAPAHVDFTLNTDAGEVKPPDLQGVEIPAGSRRSFNLGQWVTTYDVSTKVTSSDGLVICERAMYWTPPGQNWRALGHNSIGYTP